SVGWYVDAFVRRDKQMAVDRSYVESNRASLERLRALVARLSDEDFGRPIGHGWTVSAALAHLAFWDWRVVADMERWEREGVQIVPWDPNPINDGMLPEWLAMPGREAAAEALAAAEAADQKAASLAPEIVEQVTAQRPRSLIRAAHRGDHLDEIERALSHPAP
ncbi:MAG: hypothetical protein M1582_05205, partial [Actinobacteria bacterium]|nr:hypothetical protein [Actinomycetota bacterium]